MANIAGFFPLFSKVCSTGTAIDRLSGAYAIGYGRLDIYRHRPVERESGSIIGFHENGDHKRCSHVELTGLTGTEEVGTRFVPLEFDK